MLLEKDTETNAGTNADGFCLLEMVGGVEMQNNKKAFWGDRSQKGKTQSVISGTLKL